MAQERSSVLLSWLRRACPSATLDKIRGTNRIKKPAYHDPRNSVKGRPVEGRFGSKQGIKIIQIDQKDQRAHFHGSDGIVGSVGRPTLLIFWIIWKIWHRPRPADVPVLFALYIFYILLFGDPVVFRSQRHAPALLNKFQIFLICGIIQIIPLRFWPVMVLRWRCVTVPRDSAARVSKRADGTECTGRRGLVLERALGRKFTLWFCMGKTSAAGGWFFHWPAC